MSGLGFEGTLTVEDESEDGRRWKRSGVCFCLHTFGGPGSRATILSPPEDSTVLLTAEFDGFNSPVNIWELGSRMYRFKGKFLVNKLDGKPTDSPMGKMEEEKNRQYKITFQSEEDEKEFRKSAKEFVDNGLMPPIKADGPCLGL